MKVFLGGTCNNSTWRDALIPRLKELGIDYFNPVVEDWTPACQLEEENQKMFECDVQLYHITSAMTGVFSIAEAVYGATLSNLCIFSIDAKGFTAGQLKSLKATGDLIERIGGTFSKNESDLDGIVNLLAETHLSTML